MGTSSKKRALYEEINEIGTNRFARKRNENARCSKQIEELGINLAAEHTYYLGHKVQGKAPCTKWSEKIRETFAADAYQLGHDDCNPRMNLINFEPSLTQLQVPMPLQEGRMYGRMLPLGVPPVNVPQPTLVAYQPPLIENSFENYNDNFLDDLFEDNDDFLAFLEKLEPLSPNLGTTNTINATAVEDDIDNITLGVTPNPNELVNNPLPETEDIDSFPFGVHSLILDEPRDGNGFRNGNA